MGNDEADGSGAALPSPPLDSLSAGAAAASASTPLPRQYARLVVEGRSFMMHQIRKMVCMSSTFDISHHCRGHLCGRLLPLRSSASTQLPHTGSQCWPYSMVPTAAGGSRRGRGARLGGRRVDSGGAESRQCPHLTAHGPGHWPAHGTCAVPVMNWPTGMRPPRSVGRGGPTCCYCCC